MAKAMTTKQERRLATRKASKARGAITQIKRIEERLLAARGAIGVLRDNLDNDDDVADLCVLLRISDVRGQLYAAMRDLLIIKARCETYAEHHQGRAEELALDESVEAETEVVR